MQRYQIKVEYDGTNFVGWQYQKNGLSIQEILQKAIFQFSREKVTVTGAVEQIPVFMPLVKLLILIWKKK